MFSEIRCIVPRCVTYTGKRNIQTTECKSLRYGRNIAWVIFMFHCSFVCESFVDRYIAEIMILWPRKVLVKNDIFNL